MSSNSIAALLSSSRPPKPASLAARTLPGYPPSGLIFGRLPPRPRPAWYNCLALSVATERRDSGSTRDGAVTAAVEQTIAREEADRRLVFVSDLHLATDEGKRDFFAEDEFAALLDDLIAAPEPI